MATPTSDQDTQHEFFSPQKLLNEAISIITRNCTLLKFTNHTVANMIFTKSNISKNYARIFQTIFLQLANTYIIYLSMQL